jgi:hypothetical protein
VTGDRVATLARELEDARVRVSQILEGVADDQDWSSGDPHWSFRFVAAHMEACDTECVLVRVRQIAAGAKPNFEFYENTGWDFSDRDLRDSLRGWERSRAEIISFARSLSADRLARTGHHKTFGDITVTDYLAIALEHDLAHLKDLETMLAAHGEARRAQA